MLPHDPLHLYRLHEEELNRAVERRRRERDFLAQRAEERRRARSLARARRREHRTEKSGGRLLLALLLPIGRG